MAVVSLSPLPTLFSYWVAKYNLYRVSYAPPVINDLAMYNFAVNLVSISVIVRVAIAFALQLPIVCCTLPSLPPPPSPHPPPLATEHAAQPQWTLGKLMIRWEDQRFYLF